MPILNRAAELQDEIAAWRQRIHQTPELGYDVIETARFVAETLRSFGCDSVDTGIGRTGVVGVIRGRYGRPARRHGRPADHRGQRQALCVAHAWQDACLRP
jgi:hippurate hydrolase